MVEHDERRKKNTYNSRKHDVKVNKPQKILEETCVTYTQLSLSIMLRQNNSDAVTSPVQQTIIINMVE